MATALIFSRREKSTLKWAALGRTQSVGRLNMFNVFVMGAGIYAEIKLSQPFFQAWVFSWVLFASLLRV